MEKRRRPTERFRPEEGDVLEEPQEHIAERILEQHMQPTQQAASPAQLGGGRRGREAERGTRGTRGRGGRGLEREGFRLVDLCVTYFFIFKHF